MAGKNSYYFSKNVRWIFIFCASFILVVIPFWVSLIAPEFKKIADNFTYSADILSIDNFYDENLKKFQGEHISKTQFKYEVIAKTSKYLIIKNSFNVKTLSDKQIIAVNRYYFVNPYEWKHVPIEGHKREGYLFAPRYVNKKPFTYWHINYNTAAPLRYQDEEVIDGLKVYRYQTQYSADQTENLNYLPKVPEERGIIADILLQLWIEPVSGWLIKYQDNTVAYYYDKKTGKKIIPWNLFSNRYTQNSIHQQVIMAAQFKRKLLLVDYGVPLMLGTLVIVFLFLVFLRENQVKTTQKYSQYASHTLNRYGINLMVILLVLGISLEIIYYFHWHQPKQTMWKIGISKWSDGRDYNEAVQGFKAGLAEAGFVAGKDIQFIEKNPHNSVENQIRIIQEFIRDNVDLIYTLTTPGTLVAKGITTKIPIVFSIVTYPEEANIISSTHMSKNNLVGTENYISPATQYYYFEKMYPHTKTLGFVHRKGDPGSEIQFSEYKTMLEKRGINIIDIAAIDSDDLQKKIMASLKTYDALYLACDTLIQESGDIIISITQQYRIPNFSCDKRNVYQGSLLGYVTDYYKNGKLAGKKAALILQGAEPTWLHTESPREGLLIINMKTAKLMGITFPADILEQANTILEKQ